MSNVVHFPGARKPAFEPIKADVNHVKSQLQVTWTLEVLEALNVLSKTECELIEFYRNSPTKIPEGSIRWFDLAIDFFGQTIVSLEEAKRRVAHVEERLNAEPKP